MSIVQAILLGVLYWIGEANLPFVGLWTVQKTAGLRMDCGHHPWGRINGSYGWSIHQPRLFRIHFSRRVHACRYGTGRNTGGCICHNR